MPLPIHWLETPVLTPENVVGYLATSEEMLLSFIDAIDIALCAMSCVQQAYGTVLAYSRGNSSPIVVLDPVRVKSDTQYECHGLRLVFGEDCPSDIATVVRAELLRAGCTETEPRVYSIVSLRVHQPLPRPGEP